MKRSLFIILILVGCPNPVAGEPAIKIVTTTADNAPEGFSRLFKKQVDVFGVKVYATGKSPDTKVLHAAGVLAQYLDNDSDGIPDNKLVIAALRKNKGCMIMFASEREAGSTDVHRFIPEKVWDNMVLVGVHAEATRPAGAACGRFDEALEEVLHLVTSGGYASAYPDVFGEKPGTAIAKAMDTARGGHFRKVPRKYPAGAWFTYDDRSCEYASQITEYIYWGLTSILGAQDYRGRFDDIRREWRFNTADKVRKGDPVLYKLLTDPKFVFPKKLPDGKYKPKKRNRRLEIK